MPETSLYKPYLDAILRRLWISQDAQAMPSDAFAKEAVRKILESHPSPYVYAGGRVVSARLIHWLLPRRVALWLLWHKIMGTFFFF